jgi:hypothetical protein
LNGFLLGIISIGLTVSVISAVLLYFFVRDLKIVNRNSLETIQSGNVLPSNNVDTVGDFQEEQDSAALEDEEIE